VKGIPVLFVYEQKFAIRISGEYAAWQNLDDGLQQLPLTV